MGQTMGWQEAPGGRGLSTDGPVKDSFPEERHLGVLGGPGRKEGIFEPNMSGGGSLRSTER